MEVIPDSPGMTMQPISREQRSAAPSKSSESVRMTTTIFRTRALLPSRICLARSSEIFPAPYRLRPYGIPTIARRFPQCKRTDHPSQVTLPFDFDYLLEQRQ